jgi:hypothetical protein
MQRLSYYSFYDVERTFSSLTILYYAKNIGFFQCCEIVAIKLFNVFFQKFCCHEMHIIKDGRHA